MAVDNPTPAMTDARPQARLIAKWRAEADAEVARLKRYCYDGDLDGAMLDDDIEHGFAQNAQLRRCADELAALDQTAPQEPWQPIETAPKRGYLEEGIRCLVADRSGSISVASRVCVYPDGSIGGSLPSCHGSLTDWGITHWQPLPAPPVVPPSGNDR